MHHCYNIVSHGRCGFSVDIYTLVRNISGFGFLRRKALKNLLQYKILRLCTGVRMSYRAAFIIIGNILLGSASAWHGIGILAFRWCRRGICLFPADFLSTLRIISLHAFLRDIAQCLLLIILIILLLFYVLNMSLDLTKLRLRLGFNNFSSDYLFLLGTLVQPLYRRVNQWRIYGGRGGPWGLEPPHILISCYIF